MRLLTFAPLSRCSLGPLGPGPFARFAPPSLEREGSHCDRDGDRFQGRGGRTKRRLPDASADGRSLCRAGPTGAIAYQQETERAGHGHTARLRDASAACRAVCPGGPCVKIKVNSAQLRYFANRTTHSLYFHPAHADVLYGLTSMDIW